MTAADTHRVLWGSMVGLLARSTDDGVAPGSANFAAATLQRRSMGGALRLAGIGEPIPQDYRAVPTATAAADIPPPFRVRPQVIEDVVYPSALVTPTRTALLNYRGPR